MRERRLGNLLRRIGRLIVSDQYLAEAVRCILVDSQFAARQAAFGLDIFVCFTRYGGRKVKPVRR